MRLYSDLASWFHLLTHPSDYGAEAAFSTRVFEAASATRPQTLLELGSGGGNNASHMKARFTLTLTDLSPEMLGISREINPECEHIQGDMRSLRLGRTFDCVFIHDAVEYMVSHEDLRAALDTAFVHLKPGGVLLVTPDCTSETHKPGIDSGGHDGDNRSLRYLEWVHPPNERTPTYNVDFAIMLEDEDGVVTVEHDHHVFGLFSRDEWHGHLGEAGFELVEVDVEDPYADEHAVFVARRPVNG
ncbi:MAG: class I SAM-dependent methyltransferase [Anaerolinea sp.]|nr:class I SAM-dependent methyltransferase [Anaerolinea sp.]